MGLDDMACQAHISACKSDRHLALGLQTSLWLRLALLHHHAPLLEVNVENPMLTTEAKGQLKVGPLGKMRYSHYDESCSS